MPDRHPTVRNFRRVAGQAGHVNYYVEVQADGDDSRHLVFAGNIFVGPVVVISTDAEGRSTHEVVDHPRRFGEFVSSDWVDRFLESWHAAQAA
ncbi:hypothetical protein H7J06_28450 [Mycobacterium hodleri]|uniref:hypothetical protein n=1 Tax=Mycolicibacterium hodleri TaxID=49897 RepID=UPI0021F38A95|nr:hypothetical protein [Mycolicibacterium hodleri]MCV7136905.1 hypothetical protein [Mycolicibacterium hodleri]